DDGVNPPVTQVLKLTVVDPPAFTSAASDTFTIGQNRTFTVTTTAGFPATTTLSKSGNLPTGLSFATGAGGTATIKGTPAAGTGGSYTITLIASNGTNSQFTQTFTLTVKQVAAFTSATTASLVVGQPANLTVKTSGFPKPTITFDSLP